MSIQAKQKTSKTKMYGKVVIVMVTGDFPFNPDAIPVLCISGIVLLVLLVIPIVWKKGKKEDDN